MSCGRKNGRRPRLTGGERTTQTCKKNRCRARRGGGTRPSPPQERPATTRTSLLAGAGETPPWRVRARKVRARIVPDCPARPGRRGRVFRLYTRSPQYETRKERPQLEQQQLAGATQVQAPLSQEAYCGPEGIAVWEPDTDPSERTELTSPITQDPNSRGYGRRRE